MHVNAISCPDPAAYSLAFFVSCSTVPFSVPFAFLLFPFLVFFSVSFPIPSHFCYHVPFLAILSFFLVPLPLSFPFLFLFLFFCSCSFSVFFCLFVFLFLFLFLSPLFCVRSFLPFLFPLLLLLLFSAAGPCPILSNFVPFLFLFLVLSISFFCNCFLFLFAPPCPVVLLVYSVGLHFAACKGWEAKGPEDCPVRWFTWTWHTAAAPARCSGLHWPWTHAQGPGQADEWATRGDLALPVQPLEGRPGAAPETDFGIQRWWIEGLGFPHPPPQGWSGQFAGVRSVAVHPQQWWQEVQASCLPAWRSGRCYLERYAVAADCGQGRARSQGLGAREDWQSGNLPRDLLPRRWFDVDKLDRGYHPRFNPFRGLCTIYVSAYIHTHTRTDWQLECQSWSPKIATRKGGRRNNDWKIRHSILLFHVPFLFLFPFLLPLSFPLPLAFSCLIVLFLS